MILASAVTPARPGQRECRIHQFNAKSHFDPSVPNMIFSRHGKHTSQPLASLRATLVRGELRPGGELWKQATRWWT